VFINRKNAFLKKRCASTSSVEDQFCDGFVQENTSKIGRLVVAPLKNHLGKSLESFQNSHSGYNKKNDLKHWC